MPPVKYRFDSLCEFSVGKYVIEISMHPGKVTEMEVSKIIDHLHDVCEGKEYLILVEAHRKTRITLGALKLIGGKKASRHVLAKAYVIRSLHQRLMAILFQVLFRPLQPVRTFSGKARAKMWLEEIVMPWAVA